MHPRQSLRWISGALVLLSGMVVLLDERFVLSGLPRRLGYYYQGSFNVELMMKVRELMAFAPTVLGVSLVLLGCSFGDPVKVSPERWLMRMGGSALILLAAWQGLRAMLPSATVYSPFVSWSGFGWFGDPVFLVGIVIVGLAGAALLVQGLQTDSPGPNSSE